MVVVSIKGLPLPWDLKASIPLHSVPSYKEQSYKERLVDSHVTKEQRLVDLKIAKERVP